VYCWLRTLAMFPAFVGASDVISSVLSICKLTPELTSDVPTNTGKHVTSNVACAALN